MIKRKRRPKKRHSINFQSNRTWSQTTRVRVLFVSKRLNKNWQSVSLKRMDNIQIKSAIEYNCCLDYLLSYCILRLETPRILSIFRQKNVKGLGVGWMVPLRSVTFLDKKKVIMVRKHKVDNLRTTLRHI